MNCLENNRLTLGRITLIIFLIVLVISSFQLIGFEATGAHSQDGEEREVRRLVIDVRQFINEFPKAWNKPDIDHLVSMFTPEAILLTPSGHAMTRPRIRDLLVRERMELFNGKQLALSLKSISVKENYVTIEGTYTLDGYTASGFSTIPPGSIRFRLREEDSNWTIEKAEMER